jgi:hypothetical protein
MCSYPPYLKDFSTMPWLQFLRQRPLPLMDVIVAIFFGFPADVVARDVAGEEFWNFDVFQAVPHLPWLQ